jgi:hypothetical protein
MNSSTREEPGSRYASTKQWMNSTRKKRKRGICRLNSLRQHFFPLSIWPSQLSISLTSFFLHLDNTNSHNVVAIPFSGIRAYFASLFFSSFGLSFAASFASIAFSAAFCFLRMAPLNRKLFPAASIFCLNPPAPCLMFTIA